MADKSTKPKIAVIKFNNKTDSKWWHQGEAATQDAFMTELVKLDRFSVIEQEQFEALQHEHNMTLNGNIDAKTAVNVGKLLGINYLLVGTVTRYGSVEIGKTSTNFSPSKRKFVATMNAQLIETSKGKILWTDEETAEDASTKVSVGGFGSGIDDSRMFDKVMKPVIQKLTASLKAAHL